jgi:hypothetical protein
MQTGRRRRRLREWARTIATIDGELERAIGDGLFALEEERRFLVTDGYDDGAEFVAEVREWAGTHIEGAFAQRLAQERGPVQLHHEVRLRVLRAL